ncbi:hypothetical protein J2S13_002039 [Oikeobacillus pervagus]|uniref:Uncharacterized protein n=1 Tax=Oikeobacillus pervagus TaxID=1325931 RepID=A0AAJ1T2S0_9BACI|nr:hypothetical protein [Oikeobacillus pervagus]MDQ0215621.1 hypothetical protein [Oikeobacillus pervagus]
MQKIWHNGSTHPAIRKWLSLLLILFLVGCSSGKSDVTDQKEQTTTDEQTKQSQSKLSENTKIITINGNDFLDKDLEFYTLMNKMMVELKRSEDIESLEVEKVADRNAYWDEQLESYDNINVNLQSLIELNAMALLGEEKNYYIPDDIITKEEKILSEQIENRKETKALLEAYGKKKYDDSVREYLRVTMLRDRVANELEEKIKKENEGKTDKEVNYKLNQSYEDLYMDQLSTLDVKIHLK